MTPLPLAHRLLLAVFAGSLLYLLGAALLGPVKEGLGALPALAPFVVGGVVLWVRAGKRK